VKEYPACNIRVLVSEEGLGQTPMPLFVPLGYAAWTPMTERFITALKAWKFTAPVSGYTVILTGVVSQKAQQHKGVPPFMD
jgi:hypothetical protein